MGSIQENGCQRIVTRSLAVWVLLIFAEIVHGVLRAALLVPIVGEFRSSQIGVLTGSAIILSIAFFTLRWVGATQQSSLLLMGSIWLALTVAFEFSFGRLVMDLSWERLAQDYNIAEGGLMPLGLLGLLFSPMIASKLRGQR